MLGLAAGACGTTALNAATYADMTFRGRPSSSTPEQTVEKVTDVLHLTVPGTQDEAQNRRSGLGALAGILAGTTTGGALGLATGLGWRPSRPAALGVTLAAVMLAGNGPMTALGVTDPRRWSRTEWLADLLPHVAYAAATATTLRRLDPRRSR